MCRLAEAAGALWTGRKPAYHDGESVFYGLLIGVLLPLSLPAAVVFLSAFSAVFLGREMFGGFGQAPFFPPAIGLLLLYLGAPAFMQAFDFKQAQALAQHFPMPDQGASRAAALFLYRGGAGLEDVSLAALIFAGIFLILQGLLRWEWPAVYLAVFAGFEIFLRQNPASGLLSGGLFIAAFYGLAHPAGLPLRRPARVAFAALAALLGALLPGHAPGLRALAGIFMLNALSPWLDALFRPQPSPPERENA